MTMQTKSDIKVEQKDITEMKVDAVVNAANRKLAMGGGVCGAIFKKAGSAQLKEACSKFKGCKTGHAVITPGFNLKAEYIIHAVGPIWRGGDGGEAELLFDAYKNSLSLAKENNCRSIAFPLISSGIYGYPKKEAWEIAVKSCMDFINDNHDYPIEIVFAVLSDESRKLGEKTIISAKHHNEHQ